MNIRAIANYYTDHRSRILEIWLNSTTFTNSTFINKKHMTSWIERSARCAPHQLHTKEQLANKKAPYIKKKYRPAPKSDYKNEIEKLRLMAQSNIKSIRYEKRLAAHAHEFLYIVMQRMRKNGGIALGHNVVQKIIWEYLIARGLIMEIVSSNSVVFSLPCTKLSKRYETYGRKPGKYINLHFVVCATCRKNILQGGYISDNIDTIFTVIDGCLKSRKEQAAGKLSEMMYTDIIAAALIFKASDAEIDFSFRDVMTVL